ncbi:HU family DNA-binding protein [Parabacteroides segnis]|uniref:HU family DNA-binding protein n=1 Tax=Parabacteroides segnis TaxID=2763058 RepID=UPI003519758D
MNKSELVETLASRMEIPQYRVKDFINNFLAVLEEELSKEDGGIILQGFGTFRPWKQTARQGRNPRTGVQCLIRARSSVKFKPGKDLLKVLNKERV